MSGLAPDDLKRINKELSDLKWAIVHCAAATEAALGALDAYVAKNNPCPELDNLKEAIGWARRDIGDVASRLSGGFFAPE